MPGITMTYGESFKEEGFSFSNFSFLNQQETSTPSRFDKIMGQNSQYLFCKEPSLMDCQGKIKIALIVTQTSQTLSSIAGTMWTGT